MQVLLINPPCRSPYFIPSGLGYIASVLREEGHNVSMLDINAYGYSDKKVEELIRTLKFDIVGIGGLTSVYKYVKWLASIIRANFPHIPIIVGNMVSTAHPELLLRNSNVDIAVIDEGEVTIKELVSAISKGQDLKEVKGLFYKDNGNIIETPPRERISDLDSLPFPSWDLFPMEIYLNNSTQDPSTCGLRTVSISSVRGCPYDCIFCSHPFGRRVYKRSAKSVIDEIKELKKRYRVEFIYFSDDLFLVDEKWALELCERMISEKLNIKWLAALRVNLVNEKLLRRMREANCVEVGYGFESGSQIILDKIGKNFTVKQSEEAIKMTKATKLKISGSFIFGIPGETSDTIKETLAFIKRTKVPVYRFFYATAYPKTKLYGIAKEMGRLPKDEDKYLESLGEMRTNFLINFTDFSDTEFVRLKNLTQINAKRSLGFRFRLEESMQSWQRRFFTIRLSSKNLGIMLTLKMIFLTILYKLIPEKDEIRAKRKDIGFDPSTWLRTSKSKS